MNDLEIISSRIKQDDVGATHHEQALEERIATLERELDAMRKQISNVGWKVMGLAFDMADISDEIDDLYYDDPHYVYY